MSKINREEYEILKGLGDKWKWVARDKNSRWVWLFKEKPCKGRAIWEGDSSGVHYAITKGNFCFIQWEDSEPYSITELIEEYEYWQRIAQNPTVANLVGYRNECEEIEVKDNKLNRKTLDKILTEYFDETALSDDDAKIILDYHNFDDETLIELALGVVGLAWGTSGRKVVDILDDFDKLDEPETVEQTTHLLESVLRENKRLGKLLEEKHEEWFELMDEINNQEKLSKEWIEQKSIDTHVDTLNGEVQVTFRLDDLQNLLVPRQELPAVPKFVADWIVESKHNAERSLRGAFMSTPHEINDWLHEDNSGSNFDIFARAWLDGYTVEEEQKYYVINNDQRMMLVRMKDGKTITVADPFKLEGLHEGEKKSHRLTEQEIKGYDPRYMTFAKPVEELEE